MNNIPLNIVLNIETGENVDKRAIRKSEGLYYFNFILRDNIGYVDSTKYDKAELVVAGHEETPVSLSISDEGISGEIPEELLSLPTGDIEFTVNLKNKYNSNVISVNVSMYLFENLVKNEAIIKINSNEEIFIIARALSDDSKASFYGKTEINQMISNKADIDNILLYQEGYTTELTDRFEAGKYATITVKRADGTIAYTSVLSGVAPMYDTRTVTFYEDDGITVLEAYIFTQNYNEFNEWIGEVRV